MSVWLCIPSARPAVEAQACVDKWRAMGYKVALHRDEGMFDVECDYRTSTMPYPGYAAATNSLIEQVLAMDPTCDWIVTGGDDTDPDPNKRADEIAAECSARYLDLWADRLNCQSVKYDPSHWWTEATSPACVSTFGVMQPTGDRFAGGSIDRIAGSPWIGREFCQRAYGGNGPYWHEYAHMFIDQELQEVAQKLGVFWQRPDLTHLHHHFQRASDDINSGTKPALPPPHLVEANSPAHWNKFKEIYLRRRLAGFPGHAPRVEVMA